MEKWDKLCSILIEHDANDLLNNIYKLNDGNTNIKDSIQVAARQWLETNDNDIIQYLAEELELAKITKSNIQNDREGCTQSF